MSNDPPQTRAGWRLFRCDECGQQWQETSRDIYSPSGVDCACCGAWVSPHNRMSNPAVETDDMGNVIKHKCFIVNNGEVQE
jgi:hypothetical protein